MKLRRNFFLLAAIMCLALAVQPQSNSKNSARLAAKAKTMRVLGTWQGTLPCADCSGIVTTLTLYQKTRQDPSEGIYRLRMKYIDRNSFTDYGQWATLHGTDGKPDATIYQINSDNPDRAQYYLRVDDGTLQQLDREKKPIQSSFIYTLKRIGTPRK